MVAGEENAPAVRRPGRVPEIGFRAGQRFDDRFAVAVDERDHGSEGRVLIIVILILMRPEDGPGAVGGPVGAEVESVVVGQPALV